MLPLSGLLSYRQKGYFVFTDNDACIIGLTGMSGAGKTTACEAFADCGVDIINCDTVARIVVEKGKPALDELTAYFGKDILMQDGTLNRRKLGNLIFSDVQERKAFNDIIYPFISYEMLITVIKYIKNGSKYVLLDAPTLFESETDSLCDVIVSVVADKDDSIKRIMSRDNITMEEAKKRVEESKNFASDADVQAPISEPVEGIEEADAVLLEETKYEEVEVVEFEETLADEELEGYEVSEEITEEKCGIIKKNSSVICYPNMIQSALTVINNKINEMNAKLYISQKPDENKPVFTYNNKEYILGLNGDFQKYNASTVLKTVEVLRTNGVQIPEKAIEEGLKKATHMARFEFFGENIILDGGHNRDAMEELAKSLKKIKKPICLCIAMMEDKDYSECIKIVSGVITNVVTCEIDMPRCCKSEMLAKEFNKNGVNAHSYQRPEDALNKALEIAGDDGLVCICGSLYLAGYIRPFLKEITNRFT